MASAIAMDKVMTKRVLAGRRHPDAALFGCRLTDRARERIRACPTSSACR